LRLILRVRWCGAVRGSWALLGGVMISDWGKRGVSLIKGELERWRTNCVCVHKESRRWVSLHILGWRKGFILIENENSLGIIDHTWLPATRAIWYAGLKSLSRYMVNCLLSGNGTEKSSITSLPACRETLRAKKNMRYLDFTHSQFYTSL
jgi:hypothetical protein